MLTRTVLAALAGAAIAAGGSTTVLVSTAGNEHGLEQRSSRAGEAQQGAAQGVNDQTAEVQLPPCPADVKNHGAYVSSVAKANRGHGADESEDHGALVSAAAQSDCGKPEGGTEDPNDVKTSEQKAEEKAERDAAKAARKAARESGAPGKSGEPHGSAGPTGEATTTP